MPKADKLYLVGFMGAGKTTLARALAARIGWKAVDVDEWIEQRERDYARDTAASLVARTTIGRFGKGVA